MNVPNGRGLKAALPTQGVVRHAFKQIRELPSNYDVPPAYSANWIPTEIAHIVPEVVNAVALP